MRPSDAQAQRGRRRRHRRAAVDLVLALAGDEGLDDAVFQRMEADHRQAAARLQQVERALQNLFELFKLGIDENPKSLKGTRGGVLVRLAGLDRTSHDGGQLASGSHGSAAFADSNKRLCNRHSKPFFPVVTNHLCNVTLVGASEKVGRGLAAGGVHAHVQRAVETEAEAALGRVDLRRRHAQVQQQAGDLARCRARPAPRAAARSWRARSRSADRRSRPGPPSPPRRRPGRGRCRSRARPGPGATAARACARRGRRCRRRRGRPGQSRARRSLRGAGRWCATPSVSTMSRRSGCRGRRAACSCISPLRSRRRRASTTVRSDCPCPAASRPFRVRPRCGVPVG